MEHRDSVCAIVAAESVAVMLGIDLVALSVTTPCKKTPIVRSEPVRLLWAEIEPDNDRVT